MVKKLKNEVFSRLDIQINHECLQSEYSEYGDWRKTYSNSMGSVRLVDPNSNRGEPVPFEVKSGDYVYVVWAEWSSGNSSGWGKNSNTEVMAVFKSIEKADAAKKVFEGFSDSGYKFMCNYLNENDESTEAYVGWERLTEIHIDVIRVM